MLVVKSSEKMMDDGFSWTADAENRYSHQQIQTAAMCEQAAALRSIARSLSNVVGKLDAVGYDGLHDVIKAHAKKARGYRRAALARAKKRRAKLKAGA